MAYYIETIFRTIQPIVWGPPTWAILLGIGLILSIRTGFLQVTKFTHYLDRTLIDMFRKPENRKNKLKGGGDITPWQAVNTAFCATMGVGTLAGTATAIGFGGPGAVFWMWVVGFFGIATKFSEVTLAVHFRGFNKKGEVLSGPFAYMERGVGFKPLAKFFAVAGAIAAFGIGNMVQSNSAAFALEFQWGLPRLWVGIVAAILIGLVVIGGLKRIAKVVEKLIPALALTSIVASIIIILSNVTGVPYAFGLIFRGAFSSEGLVGGVLGVSIMYAIRFGLMRGIFSNEAGLGSAPIAYAAAKTDHPTKQGLWGAVEVFMDTHVMCTLIALVILVTVPLGVIAPGTAPGMTGSPLVIYAFSSSLFGPVFGGGLMTILIAMFGFTTVIGWAFYGEKCFEYLFGLKPILGYRLAMLPICVFGATGGVAAIWAIADTLNAFMVVPNIIALLLLSGTVKKLMNDYFKNPDKIDYTFEKITPESK
ncbi:MAG: sodium:alanine symporter family protein [Treponema sp.]|nr:sodium:alanine symporter family protein [Treponema sp.]